MTTHLTVGRRSTGPRLVACLLVGLLLATTSGRGQVMAVNGMVVSSHPMATEAGLRILQQGGNAFDAAVAVAATLGVVEPLMSGLGGVGGYALIYDSKKQQIRSLDFIGAAPAATKPELFTAGARLWDRAHPARDSFVAPVVPGNLAGWGALHDQVRHDDMATAARACHRIRGQRIRRHPGGA